MVAGAFLAPFLYGLYWKGVTKASVWASFAVGVGITVANMFFKFIASPINAGAVAMVAGLVVVPIVNALVREAERNLKDLTSESKENMNNANNPYNKTEPFYIK